PPNAKDPKRGPALGRLPGIGHELLRFLFRFAHKNLSTLDPSSLVNIAALFDSRREQSSLLAVAWLTKENTSAREVFSFANGRLPGIEPGLPVPQTGVITVIQ